MVRSGTAVKTINPKFDTMSVDRGVALITRAQTNGHCCRKAILLAAERLNDKTDKGFVSVRIGRAVKQFFKTETSCEFKQFYGRKQTVTGELNIRLLLDEDA